MWKSQLWQQDTKVFVCTSLQISPIFVYKSTNTPQVYTIFVYTSLQISTIFVYKSTNRQVHSIVVYTSTHYDTQVRYAWVPCYVNIKY